MQQPQVQVQPRRGSGSNSRTPTPPPQQQEQQQQQQQQPSPPVGGGARGNQPPLGGIHIAYPAGGVAPTVSVRVGVGAAGTSPMNNSGTSANTPHHFSSQPPTPTVQVGFGPSSANSSRSNPGSPLATPPPPAPPSSSSSSTTATCGGPQTNININHSGLNGSVGTTHSTPHHHQQQQQQQNHPPSPIVQRTRSGFSSGSNLRGAHSGQNTPKTTSPILSPATGASFPPPCTGGGGGGGGSGVGTPVYCGLANSPPTSGGTPNQLPPPVWPHRSGSNSGERDDDKDSLFSGSSNASSVKEDLPLCPDDETCVLLNDRKHQRHFAHTCRLNPCYHGNVRYHSRLFRHAPGQVVNIGEDSMSGRSTPDKASQGTRHRRRTKKALTSVSYSSISPDAPNAVKITVVCNDSAYEIWGDWANVKVHTLKRYLQQVLGIPPAAQRLSVNFTQLVEDDLLSAAESGVEEGATLAVQVNTEQVDPSQLGNERLAAAISAQERKDKEKEHEVQQPQQQQKQCQQQNEDGQPNVLHQPDARKPTTHSSTTGNSCSPSPSKGDRDVLVPAAAKARNPNQAASRPTIDDL